jgi:hypothetical protein
VRVTNRDHIASPVLLCAATLIGLAVGPGLVQANHVVPACRKAQDGTDQNPIYLAPAGSTITASNPAAGTLAVIVTPDGTRYPVSESYELDLSGKQDADSNPLEPCPKGGHWVKPDLDQLPDAKGFWAIPGIPVAEVRLRYSNDPTKDVTTIQNPRSPESEHVIE